MHFAERFVLSLAGAATASMLVACEPAPAPSAADASTPAGAAPAAGASTPAIAIAAAAASGLPADHASSRRYKIAIDLPALSAQQQPLADALRATADDAKREFMQGLPDPQQLPEFADRQLQLALDFKLAASTPAFVSVVESGAMDTGGAHPIPVAASFVFDRRAGRLVTLDGLFADPDAARKALARFAHDALLERFMADAPKPGEGTAQALQEWKSNMLQMLDEGSKPTPDNYALFTVRAGASGGAASPGLTLIFTPYQVAPYVYGTQTVDVPARVFAGFLKPAYEGDFAR
ncbi:MAG TPA: RsiV family protein [Burkholderiaceae bacterium]|nr:RsiV family protein [Burkholderiaceae bacterium]